MNPENRLNQLMSKAEAAGAITAIVGFAAIIVSGVSFISSGSHLSEQEVQRLVTQVNAFDAVLKSTLIAGAGAAVALGANQVRK